MTTSDLIMVQPAGFVSPREFGRREFAAHSRPRRLLVRRGLGLAPILTNGTLDRSNEPAIPVSVPSGFLVMQCAGWPNCGLATPTTVPVTVTPAPVTVTPAPILAPTSQPVATSGGISIFWVVLLAAGAFWFLLPPGGGDGVTRGRR